MPAAKLRSILVPAAIGLASAAYAVPWSWPLILGDAPGSYDEVHLDSLTDSIYDITGEAPTLIVGNQGTGLLEIGSLITNECCILRLNDTTGNNAAVIVAAQPGSTGTIRLNQNSSLNAGSQLLIGMDRTGAPGGVGIVSLYSELYSFYSPSLHAESIKVGSDGYLGAARGQSNYAPSITGNIVNYGTASLVSANVDGSMVNHGLLRGDGFYTRYAFGLNTTGSFTQPASGVTEVFIRPYDGVYISEVNGTVFSDQSITLDGTLVVHTNGNIGYYDEVYTLMTAAGGISYAATLNVLADLANMPGYEMVTNFGANALTVSFVYTPPVCGNGELEFGEQCDDGNLVDGDGCSSSCTLEPVCGNGVVETGEQCDDGNLVDGDGCSSACLSEVADIALSGNSVKSKNRGTTLIDYVYVIDNNGPADAYGTEFSATFDAGESLQSVTSSQGSCTGGSCELGVIPAGASATVQFQTRYDGNAKTISSQGTATSTTADPDDSNNAAVVTTTLKGKGS